jgi:hypothetical protein
LDIEVELSMLFKALALSEEPQTSQTLIYSYHSQSNFDRGLNPVCQECAQSMRACPYDMKYSCSGMLLAISLGAWPPANFLNLLSACALLTIV